MYYIEKQIIIRYIFVKLNQSPCGKSPLPPYIATEFFIFSP